MNASARTEKVRLSLLRLLSVFALTGALFLSASCKGTTKSKSNALWHAAADGNLSEVQELLDRGADVNGQNEEGEPPLHGAAAYGHLVVAKYLVSQGADIDGRSRIGSTPTHDAAYAGHLEMVEYLLSEGAEADARGLVGKDTPLLLAASGGHVRVVEFLLSKGANPDAKNVYGQTPLDSAVRNDRKDVIAFLASLDPNSERSKRLTEWLRNNAQRQQP